MPPFCLKMLFLPLPLKGKGKEKTVDAFLSQVSRENIIIQVKAIEKQGKRLDPAPLLVT